ncbi:DUF2303 family protein [Pseudorhodoferax sp. Leaf274]|uniref:DUF2303 family protein n=1 Tax=Pseudorhodoferax sp. Leaf274 TaxID=1736318 RepID=UPI000702A45E|nr:DUF2303 family protein [Pseudorhodoferax sp. Leaf274]KQP37579.1 hypothetical protein ASF44_14650 [Pseudorhodoferax sp. Leaf274]
MTPTPQDGNDNTASTLQIAAVLTELTAAAIAPVQVGNNHFVILPPGYEHKDITDLVAKTKDTPARKSGTTVVHDVPSLLLLCADRAQEHADAQGYIYADLTGRAITAVWNDQRQAHTPGWRDHRAVFKAELTPEFKRWIENDRKQMSQETFAEFIEDNAVDLPEATLLLEVAGTLQAKTDVQFRSARRLDNGQVQLGYTETINTTAGAEGALTVPKEFKVGVRIFKNGSGYLINARLKYRLLQGAVKFFYELDRPERAVELAFEGYVKEVREKSGYTPILAGASGPHHEQNVSDRTRRARAH